MSTASPLDSPDDGTDDKDVVRGTVVWYGSIVTNVIWTVANF